MGAFVRVEVELFPGYLLPRAFFGAPRWLFECLFGQVKLSFLVSGGQKPIVADSHKSRRKNMAGKPSEEFGTR
jgi:hypothetical protein